MSDVELDKLLERQFRLEKKVAKLICKTTKKSRNSVFKLYLDRLALDSLKHADMIQVTMDLRKGTVVSLPEKEGMEKALKDHIAREKEMLKGLEEILLKVHEPKVKLLLQHISEDEKKHHEILTEVTKILGWRDATQEDWWNTIDRAEWLF